MARTDSLDNFLADVATAIKTKKSSQVDIPAADFDTEILALPSQGVYETRTINITQNGSQTITPDIGYDAIDEITINTNVPEKQLQTGSYSFTANTTIQLVPEQGYDGFDQVNLSINVAETDLSPELNTQDLDLANMRLAINNRGQERLNIFAQLEEPVVAKGIWLQTDKQVDNIIQDENVFASGQWNYDKMETIRSMPYWDTYVLGAAYVGNCVYWWGRNNEGSSSNTQAGTKYDFSTNTYTKLANSPSYYGDRCTVCAVGNDIYLYGSNSNVYKYNILTNSYTSRASLPRISNNGTYAIYAVAKGTNIYLAVNYSYGSNAFICKYDILTNTYTVQFSLYTGSQSAKFASVGDYIYIFGGYTSGSGSYLATSYKYNMINNTYTQISNLPIATMRGSAISCGTDIYLFGRTKK